MNDPGAEELSPWDQAALAAALFAVDPAGLGGIHVRARAGPVRDHWLDALRTLTGPSVSIRKLPAGITDDRLLGGLDLPATLKAGKPIAQRGLLAESDGGILLIPMAERFAPSTAAQIAAAMDSGAVRLERDGLAATNPARFGIIAFDEGVEDDEQPPAALLERLAFALDLSHLPMRETGPFLHGADEIAAARTRLASVSGDDAVIETLCGVAAALGVLSLRAPLHALKAARAAAALDGRNVMEDQDAALAARLVLAPRATILPLPEEPDTDEADAPEPPENDPSSEPGEERDLDDRPLEDVVLEAALASIPDDLLARLKLAQEGRTRSAASGKAGAMGQAVHRGRPVGVRRGSPGGGARLNVIETLRAAAPWQRLRRETAPDTAKSSARSVETRRVEVRADDFRITRFHQHTETVTIFAVDASGSAALHRLAEAKGAVELVLAECYVRRDQVALVAFRGAGAEMLLPPTRSLVRAKRGLAGLPGGGGTPLAAGLDAAFALADTVKRKGQSPVVMVLTDGRANIARDGAADRARATQDAIEAAKLFRLRRITSILVDTSPRRRAEAETLAREMGARYVALPHADAAKLSGIAREVAMAS